MTKQFLPGPNVTVTSNGRERDLLCLADLPEKDRRDFDYIEGEEVWDARLFKAYGVWYDAHEFEVAPPEYQAAGWEGVQPESYWNAMVIRYATTETVVAGSATW